MRGRALIVAGLVIMLLPALASSAVRARAPSRGKSAPAALRGKSAPPPARGKKAPAPAASTNTPLLHEVRRGETISAIARQYDVTVSSIVIANRLRGPRARLVVGQRLTIPRRPGVPVPPPGRRRPRGPVDEPLPVSLVLSVPDFEETAPVFRWPVEGPVTSTFGRRSHSWHRGVDIRADPGTPVAASARGVVIASDEEPRYGQIVKIEHDGGFVTVYAHNERNLVEVGEEVSEGQVIALVGRTGRATAEHVHFEIRYEGRVYNPLYLLPMPPRSVHVALDPETPEEDE